MSKDELFNRAKICSRGNICNRIDFGVLTLIENAPDKGRGIAYDIGWTDVKLKVSEKIFKLSPELKGMKKRLKKGKTGNKK